MRIVPVSEILTPAGLAEPEFSALLPTQDNYSALLIQPQGDITADEHGVRHTDTVLAGRQFRDFFAKAVSTRASLAVAPEYSVPWETLMAALQGGTRPAKGALWALGCEGIKYSQLLAMRTDLAADVTFLFEVQQPDDTRFCDPLVYVFEANFSADNSRSTLVCLVQFKTCAFGDKEHFEVNGMQKGTQIYQLGHRSGIRLTSLLCSDSFAFEDADALVVYDRALVLHLQLNPKPRQDQYRLSRNKLFYSADGATQLICLNWAAGVTERSGGKVKSWKKNHLAFLWVHA